MNLVHFLHIREMKQFRQISTFCQPIELYLSLDKFVMGSIIQNLLLIWGDEMRIKLLNNEHINVQIVRFTAKID